MRRKSKAKKVVKPRATKKVGVATPEMKTVSAGDADALGIPKPRDEKGDPEKEARSAGVPESQAPGPSAAETSAGMLAVCDQAMYAAVKVSASSHKLRWNEELTALSRLSSDERSTLSMFAPMAAPYFSQAVQKAPAVGAAFFGLALVFMIVHHNRAVAEIAAKERKDPKAKAWSDTKRKEDGSKPTPQEKMRHDLDWGAAHDAVPVGTVPVDVGLPKKFTPSEQDAA